MRYKPRESTYNMPRLAIEKSRTAPGHTIGFLQLGMSGKKIKIGDADDREFRLMLCLFSPKNFLSAKYEPVLQTYERVFETMRIRTNSVNSLFANREEVESEMTATVESSIRMLQRGEVGRYIAFASKEGKVRMEILR